MANYPYQKLGLPLDLRNWERLNNNFKDIEGDFREQLGQIEELDERVDNLVTGPSAGILEVQDARQSTALGETFVTLRERLEAENNDIIRMLLYRSIQSTLLHKAFLKIRNNEAFKLVCMGDSLTYGYDVVSGDRRPPDSVPTPDGSTHLFDRASVTYPEALSDFLNEVYPAGVTVETRGYSGSTTESNFPKWAGSNPNSDLTVIMLGTNDSAQNKGIPNYLQWFRKIIERELEWASGVILLTPPRRRDVSIKDDAYANAVFNLGAEYGCPVVDMMEMTANMSASNFSDGTHLNGDGYRYLGARIASLFIGEGVVNPLHVSTGTTLLTRQNIDGAKFISGVSATTSTGYPTADDSVANNGLAAAFAPGFSTMIYSFYTEEDDLLIYPSFYFPPASNEPVMFELDFGLESQSVSNLYMFDTDNAVSTDRHVPTSVFYYKADGNWRVGKDVFYMNAVKSLDVPKIHVPKKGWHTLKITGDGIRFHSIDFISYDIMRTKVYTNALLNPEFKELTLENGWTVATGAMLNVYKQGRFVHISGGVQKSPKDTTVITTLPVGYRPYKLYRALISAGATSAIQTAEPKLTINQNGTVQLTHIGNTTTDVIIINETFVTADD